MVLHEQLQPIAEVVNMSRFCISVVNKKAKFNSNDDDDDDDDDDNLLLTLFRCQRKTVTHKPYSLTYRPH